LHTPTISPAICCAITAHFAHPYHITGNMLRYYSTFSYGVADLIQAMNGRNGANVTPSLLRYSGTAIAGRHRKLLKLVATSTTRSTLD